MKKRIVSTILTLSILLSMIPLNILTVFGENGILYGDADGSGKVESVGCQSNGTIHRRRRRCCK